MSSTRQAYRGVYIDKDGKTRYGKCYDKIGPAKAWVTSNRRYPGGRPNSNFVDGWVEKAILWDKVE